MKIEGKRIWQPYKLFMQDFWFLPKKMEFFEAICALVGSGKGCEEGFRRSFDKTNKWEKICFLYDSFLKEARKGALLVEGNLGDYPSTAAEISPAIENRLRCFVQFRELVCFTLLQWNSLSSDVQNELVNCHSFHLPAFNQSFMISVGTDKRHLGGACIASGLSFPLDFEVKLEILGERDRALAFAQAAAVALIHVDPSLAKKDLYTALKELPFVGGFTKEFRGANTIRNWSKPIFQEKGKRGRSKNGSTFTKIKLVELSIDQTLSDWAHAQELMYYLARLKASVFSIAITFAHKKSLSEEEIFVHEFIQQLLQPVSINIGLVSQKEIWARKWIREAVLKKSREKS